MTVLCHRVYSGLEIYFNKMKKKLNIAVSGIGNRALPKGIQTSNWLGWVELIHRSDEFELVAAHDPSAESIQRMVERGYLKPEQNFTDLTRMLTNVPCDALLVCNPVQYHASTIRQAIDHDLHLLVEKPFTDDLQEGRELVSLIQRKKLTACVVQNWRNKDVGRLMHQHIQDGQLGKIGHIFFRYVRDRENPKLPPYIFQEKFPLLYAMGIHHLDLFRYILNDEIISVQGQSFKPDWSLYESDTGLNLFLKTKRGTSIIYSGTISSPNKVISQESLIVEGEKGTLINESQWSEPPLWYYPKGIVDRIELTKHIKGQDRETTEQYNRSDRNILRNFSQSILGKEEPVCRAEDALKSIEVLEASRRACETGEVVYLDTTPELQLENS